MTTQQRQILATFLLLPTLTFAEGQWGMDYFIWTIDFIEVFGLWTIGALTLLYILKKIRQQSLTKKQKYIFWTVILFSAFFHWSMTTYDPHPTEGPMDSLFWRQRVQDKKMADSLSTYEEYSNAIANQEMQEFQNQNNSGIVDSVLNIVEKLKIVQDQIKLVDSLSKGQRHISLVPTIDDSTKNIYLVQVGEQNDFKLVTYFNFLVDAKTMTIINKNGKLDGQ